GIAGEEEAKRAALGPKPTGGFHIFGQPLVPEQAGCEQDPERPVSARGRGAANEPGAIDAGAWDQAYMPRVHQSRLLEQCGVVGVLEDEAGTLAVERKLQQPAHEGSQQPSLGGIAYEDVAHAGHGVHASGDPGKARSNRAVHSTLDGEAVDDVGALAAEEANEVDEQAGFAQRVQAAPIHGYRL